MTTDKIRISELTAQESRDYLTEEAVILLPMGSLEDQGTHAPMGDWMAADVVAMEMAKAAREMGVPTFVAPCLPFGGKDYFESTHGGISIRQSTLVALLDDMLGSLARHGLKKLLIVNGHGGNVTAITEVALRWRQKTGMFVPSIYLWQVAYGLLPEIVGKEVAAKVSGHGGDPLTSMGLCHYPELLRPDLMREPPKDAKILGMEIGGFSSIVYGGAKIQAPLEALEAAPNGNWACDPKLSSAETGKALTEKLVAIGAGLIRDHISKGLESKGLIAE